MDVDRQFSVYGQDKGKAKVFEDADSILNICHRTRYRNDNPGHFMPF